MVCVLVVYLLGFVLRAVFCDLCLRAFARVFGCVLFWFVLFVVG